MLCSKNSCTGCLSCQNICPKNAIQVITDKQGFPRAHRMRTKRVFGFATGDTVRAVNAKGKFPGTHIGRIVVRKNGGFDVHTKNRKILSNWKNCSTLACYDGYGYQLGRVGGL